MIEERIKERKKGRKGRLRQGRRGGDYGYFSFAASSQTNKPIIEQLIFKESVCF